MLAAQADQQLSGFPCLTLWWLSRQTPQASSQRAVEVWPASGESQRLEPIELLQAGSEFPGLQLQLAEICAG